MNPPSYGSVLNKPAPNSEDKDSHWKETRKNTQFMSF